jgi:hypothetical protein
MLTILAATVLLSGSTLMANEGGVANTPAMGPDAGKDTCLLVAMNCSGSVDDIQASIQRLNKEIAKGTDVYTRDELNILRRKLDDVNKQLESIVNGA